MTDQEMQVGTVKYFDFKKKFGFITPDSDEEDIFVHFSNIVATGKSKRLRQGDRVQYATAEGDQGKRKAVDVSIITEGIPVNQPIEKPEFSGRIQESEAFPHEIINPKFADNLAVIEKTLEAPSIITLKFDNFESISAKTDETYRGTIEIVYEPTDSIIELNSLAYYLDRFAMISTYYEQVLSVIYKDIHAICNPYSLEVTGKFNFDNKFESKITIGPDNHN